MDFTSKFFNRKNEETEEMRLKKEILLKSITKTKKLEKDLINQKLTERENKLAYQHACPHKVLIPVKNSEQSNSTTFNDYTAKCELCEAQLWNKNRSMAYIYSLIDMLNKFPKITETLKILDLESEEDMQTRSKILELIKTLSNLKERLNEISDKEISEVFTSKYKNNISK